MLIAYAYFGLSLQIVSRICDYVSYRMSRFESSQEVAGARKSALVHA